MREYITQAIVLNVRTWREFDKEAVFFSKDLGKFRAMLVGGRRITSKFSPHCDALKKVTLRVVHKNRYTVTDILEEKSLVDATKGVATKNAFLLANLLERNLPDEAPDEVLWEKTLFDLEKTSFLFSEYLAHLGYDILHASCVHCGKSPIYAFLFNTQVFVCRSCGSKTDGNELLLL